MTHRNKAVTASVVLTLCFSSVAHSQPIESVIWKVAVTSTLALVYITNPTGADAMTAEMGGGEDVAVARIAAKWDWKHDLLRVGNYRLDTYWQLEYAKWQSTIDASQKESNNALGIAPIFRFVGDWGSVAPYVDTGVGINSITNTRINNSQLSSNFQFSDQFGTGLKFGKQLQWEVGYRFQHYSNGSVKVPNNGINMHFLNVSYRYPQKAQNE